MADNNSWANYAPFAHKGTIELIDLPIILQFHSHCVNALESN